MDNFLGRIEWWGRLFIAITEDADKEKNDNYPSPLKGVMATFSDTARYDDELWGEFFMGRDGIRLFYEQILKALPDLDIEVLCQHVTVAAVLVEVMIRGTHFGKWRDLAATGRRVEFPLCGVYTFDVDDRLAGEKIYYDRGTVLRQLGLSMSHRAYWAKSPYG